MTQEHALAQLRHLYSLMLAGNVKDCEQAAHGLLGPAIEWLEVARRVEEEQAETIRNLASVLESERGFHHSPHYEEGGPVADCTRGRCGVITKALRKAGLL